MVFSLLLSLLLAISFDKRIPVLVGFSGSKVVWIHDLKPLAKLFKRHVAPHTT